MSRATMSPSRATRGRGVGADGAETTPASTPATVRTGKRHARGRPRERAVEHGARAAATATAVAAAADGTTTTTENVKRCARDGAKTDDGRASAPGRDGTTWGKTGAPSARDVRAVQSLLERSLRLYMSKEEVVNHLKTLANIDPLFTHLVWAQLEKDNEEFFKAYHVMVRVKEQILRFNSLLDKYYELAREKGEIDADRHPIGQAIEANGSGKMAKQEPARRGGAQRKQSTAKANTPTKTPVRATNASGARASELPVMTPRALADWGARGPETTSAAATPRVPAFVSPYEAHPELSDEIAKLMRTPQMIGMADLQLDFDNYIGQLTSSDAEPFQLASLFPRDFSLDEVPDLGI